MIEILLGSRKYPGHVAFIDDEDYELISNYRWCIARDRRIFYAVTTTHPHIKMHRLILALNKNIQADHKNGNGLDNRRENLRIADASQNQANSRKRKIEISRSHFKGIYWQKHSKLWNARVALHKKTYSLGYFKSEEEAALAYDKGAREKFGEFARPNFRA